MAAPTLQAQGSMLLVTTGSVSPTIPAHQADDILLASVEAWVPNTTGDAAAIPTPSGWTEIVQLQTPASGEINGRIAFFWRRATGSGTTVTFTRGASWDTGADTSFAARVDVIRGCETSGDPWDEADPTAIINSSNGSCEAVTVSGSERLVVHHLISQDNNTMSAAPSGWTLGTNSSDAGGTDATTGNFRKDNQSADTSAGAATLTAPAQGFYVFLGISYKPPAAGASETPTPGGATAGGSGPTARAAASPGGATAAGSAPSPKASAAPGGAVVGGSAPTASAAVTPGGAVAGGQLADPGSGTEETPTPGGAVAGGAGPSARATAATGGAIAGGTAPSPRVALSPGGAVAGGATPAARTTFSPGGAVVGGSGPTARVTFSPGGAIGGGQLEDPLGGGISETPTPGGAVVGGVSPTTRVSLAAGGAAGGGFTPSPGSAPGLGGVSTGGFGPTVRVSVSPGGAVAGGQLTDPAAVFVIEFYDSPTPMSNRYDRASPDSHYDVPTPGGIVA